MGVLGQDFAARLGGLMAELNLSRVGLARELGVDKSVVGRWLNGVTRPTDHNLSRLTSVLRRERPDITRAFWEQQAAPPPAVNAYGSGGHGSGGPGSGGHGSGGPGGGRMALTGLRLPAHPAVDANHAGLWAGFYQSAANRGAVVLCALHLWSDEQGLRCAFTEGKVTGEGVAVAAGARLHGIVEIAPLHDRLCFFILNGVGSAGTLVMEGVKSISSGDAMACAVATPILLIRIGDAGDFARAGGLAGLMQAVLAVNMPNVQQSAQAGDPMAGLADIAPESVLRLVCPRVGAPREDGEIDHVLRMPASRSLVPGDFSAAELPDTSPAIQTRNNLRRRLGLD